jgi:hypothetical protein
MEIIDRTRKIPGDRITKIAVELKMIIIMIAHEDEIKRAELNMKSINSLNDLYT